MSAADDFIIVEDRAKFQWWPVRGMASSCRSMRSSGCGGRCGGLLNDSLRGLATYGNERGWRTHAIAFQRIVPLNVSGQGIKAVNVAICGHDQAVEIQKQRDVTTFHLVVGPNNFACVAVKGYGIAI